jgi:hypothetical protein
LGETREAVDNNDDARHRRSFRSTDKNGIVIQRNSGIQALIDWRGSRIDLATRLGEVQVEDATLDQ